MMHSGRAHGFFAPLFEDEVTAPAAYSYRNDPDVPDFPDDLPVIVFDGDCALCSGWAALILQQDRTPSYRMLAAQSELGRALYVHYGLDPSDYETNLLIENGVAWYRSEACIRMATRLGGFWRLVAVFRLLPTRLRDRLYGCLARNRMRWFGRRHECYTPEPGDADRFLS